MEPNYDGSVAVLVLLPFSGTARRFSTVSCDDAS